MYFLLQDVALNSLRFLFDGQRINDDQTPKDVSIGKYCAKMSLTIWGLILCSISNNYLLKIFHEFFIG